MPKPSSPLRRLIELWVGLRLFTMAWAALIALIRPTTPREQIIPFWPASAPYLQWIERMIFAPWERWDAHLFVRTVRAGWSSDNGTSQFHPLLPLLAKPFAALSLEPIVALFLIASAASLAAVFGLYRLARLDWPESASEVACVTFLAFPVSAILFAAYTEPLWIACAVFGLLWAREGRWLQAGLAVAGATLTRQQGLFLMLPIAWELWEAHGRKWRGAIRDWRGMAAVLAAPAAYAAWVLYRGIMLQDARPNFTSVHAFLYSTLLSPSSVKVVPTQTMLWPWEGIYQAIRITNDNPAMNNVLNLVMGALFLLMTAIAWRYMRASYRLLTATLLLVSFAYHTGPAIPYMGLPRHLLLAFPVFLGLGPFLERGHRRFVTAAVFTPLMLVVVMMYVLQAWVP